MSIILRAYFVAFTSLFFCQATAFGQVNHLMASKQINSYQEAKKYAEGYPEVSLVFLHEELENPIYLQSKDTLKSGDYLKMQMYHMRVVSASKKQLQHCSYIVLNEAELEEGEGAVLEKEILKKRKEGVPFKALHTEYSMDGNTNFGDLGYVDPDHMSPAFKDALRKHAYPDMFSCRDTLYNFRYIIEIDRKPKLVKGHYVLFFPEQAFSDPNVDHDANLKEIKSAEEMQQYAREHPDVDLTLMNRTSNETFFNILEASEKTSYVGQSIEFEDYRYVVLKDTTVRLYSFKYILINGEELTEKERKKRVNEIYKRYQKGESFDHLIAEYGPEDNTYNTMMHVEEALLLEELVDQLNKKPVNELFVARRSQSYFVGILMEPVEIVDAYLTISYPVY